MYPFRARLVGIKSNKAKGVQDGGKFFCIKTLRRIEDDVATWTAIPLINLISFDIAQHVATGPAITFVNLVALDVEKNIAAGTAIAFIGFVISDVANHVAATGAIALIDFVANNVAIHFYQIATARTIAFVKFHKFTFQNRVSRICGTQSTFLREAAAQSAYALGNQQSSAKRISLRMSMTVLLKSANTNDRSFSHGI